MRPNPLPVTIDLHTLQIITLTDLFLHEEPDPVRSEQLADTLLQQGILRNPPIVFPTNTFEKRYIVLVGANRVPALKKNWISLHNCASGPKW
jgi:hypothetical protein